MLAEDLKPMISLRDAMALTYDFPPDPGDLAGWAALVPDPALKHPAGNRRNTLLNKLSAVNALIAEGEFEEAVEKLRNDLRAKGDGFLPGANPNNDWITDPFYQQPWVELIDMLIRDLEMGN